MAELTPTPTPTPMPIRADSASPAPSSGSAVSAGLVSTGMDVSDGVPVVGGSDDGIEGGVWVTSNSTGEDEVADADTVSLSSSSSGVVLGGGRYTPGPGGTLPGIHITDSPSELPSRTRPSRTEDAVKATVRGLWGHQQSSGDVRVSGEPDCEQANHSSEVPLQ